MAEAKIADLMAALTALFNDKAKLKEILGRIEKEKDYGNGVTGDQWRKLVSERWEETRRNVISLSGFLHDERFNEQVKNITAELAIPQSK